MLLATRAPLHKWLTTTLWDQYQKAYGDLLVEINKNAQGTIMANINQRIIAASAHGPCSGAHGYDSSG